MDSVLAIQPILVESWSPQKPSYPEKMFPSNILASVDAGKCVLSHIKNSHKSPFRKIYCDHLKIALFEVYSLVIFKENTAPAGVDSYAYLYFRIINARFLGRIHINASRERHKQYACTQTQGVNGYQLVITCRLSKGVPELRNPLFSYRPMIKEQAEASWMQICQQIVHLF